MRVLFDSSAFAKRFVFDAGSDEVLTWCDQATELALASIALPEIVSAFCRLRREGKIAPAQYRRLKSSLLADLEDIAICELTAQVMQHAVVALETNVLRAMDAIHIGCALAWRAEAFISADRRQCDAAKAAGLRVVRV
jgi:uncharacterized protein